MKKIFLFCQVTIFALLVLLLASCNQHFQKSATAKFVKHVTEYATTHCPKSASYFNPKTGQTILTFECGNLWPTEGVQEVCKSAQICIDVSAGKIYGNLDCISPLKVPDLSKIITAPKQ